MDKNISFTLKIWRQNGPKEQGKVRNRLCSIMIAVKVFAVCALSTSTDTRTDPQQAQQPASSICAVSMTVM